MTNTKRIFNPSNFTYTISNILYNHQGIDTIRLIAKYDVVKKLCDRLGLNITLPQSNTPLSQKIKDFEAKASIDKATRYKKELFKPTMEVVKLSQGMALSNYMVITRNTPLLFDYAKHHKKAKDTYCTIEFSGLHQPTAKINKEAIQLISKFLKRKAFKVYSMDVAIDTKDPKDVNYRRKKEHGKTAKQLKKNSVVSHGSSLYINKPKGDNIGRVLYYDKFSKEVKYHKKRLSPSLKEWKRLEITFALNIYQKASRRGFIEYVNSTQFLDAMAEAQTITKQYRIKSYDDTYLIYQLNSFIDNRVINNKESKTRFNSIESVKRFEVSDFRRWIIAI